MRVLVACEYSGTVRNAFLELGHDAWSCDLLPSEDGSNRHIIGDARDLLNDGWDLLMVAHPPCTRLCNSGVRWLTKPPPGKTKEQMWRELDEGAALFSDFWNAPIERIAIENPVMHKHAKARIVTFRSSPRASSLGSSGMEKLSAPACGSRTCRLWSRRTWSRGARRGFTTCRPPPTAGRSGLGSFPELRRRWRTNGALLLGPTARREAGSSGQAGR